MNFDPFRQYTQARIGLGNQGPGLPTKAFLEFAFHHALAVDAVKLPWDISKQANVLKAHGFCSQILKTKVDNRQQYLLRPDLGRLLHDESKNELKKLKKSPGILVMVSNGLSSLAITTHLPRFLSILASKFEREKLKLAYERVMLIANARVGLIDDLGAILKPELGLVIIGERPGLSAPDSLAVYLTYRPKAGRVDAERNCVSNIRPPHGLGYEEASTKVVFLIKQAISRKLSGVMLKEEASLRP